MTRFLVAVGLLAAVGAARAQPDVEAAKEKRTELSAKSLLQACEAFYLNPKSGAYPKTLGELGRPPFGGASYVRDPANDLLDAWGQEYRYKVVTFPNGRQQPFIWSERVVNGKTRVVGVKPPELKKE